MGIGIADNWFKEKFYKTMMKGVDKVGHGMTESQKHTLVEKTTNFYMFIVMISFAIFMIYFFSTIVYNRAGFDRTIIVILTIILLRMRWK